MVSCGWLGVSAYQTCILLGYMIENSRFTVQVESVFGKKLFVLKYMIMMFFYFLKIIFDISISKRSKKYKPHSILTKKKFQNLMKRSYNQNAERYLKLSSHHCNTASLHAQLNREGNNFFFSARSSPANWVTTHNDD